MIDYSEFFKHLEQGPLKQWTPYLKELTEQIIENPQHGQWQEWTSALQKLPKSTPSTYNLQSDKIQVGIREDLSNYNEDNIKTNLKQFHPWRKGPFDFFGTHIDTEWQSQLKWNRLKSHISNLNGRTVADIGSGNGYFSWHMVGEGAETVIAVDITLLYIIQFWVFQTYLQNPKIAVLPLSLEQLHPIQDACDTVFSMGVLYHAKEPLNHLEQLHNLLRPDGELVLETLYVEDSFGPILHPQGRYAKMRNVHQLPSIATLTDWLKKSNFSNIRCVDRDVTSLNEQRSTEWMNFDSLKDFLDPNDVTLTCEGHPSPQRVVLIANKL